MELTERQAYDAMFLFLSEHWLRGGKRSEDLAILLGALSRDTFSDRVSADPALLNDWEKCVERIVGRTRPLLVVPPNESLSPPRRLGEPHRVNQSAADHFLRDLGYLVRERANEVKAEVARGDGSRDELMAYYWVVSLMQQQAEAFGIPLERLCLDGIDPEADLL